jgi:hypothetical protein
MEIKQHPHGTARQADFPPSLKKTWADHLLPDRLDKRRKVGLERPELNSNYLPVHLARGEQKLAAFGELCPD